MVLLKVDSYANNSDALSQISLIASDMDGTLLSPGSILAPATADAISDLSKTSDVPLVLATGRSRAAALARVASTEADFSIWPGIFLNGAVAYGDDGRLVHEAKLEHDILREVISMFKDDMDSVVVMAISGDSVLVPVHSEVSFYIHLKYADPRPTVFEGYSAMVDWIVNSNTSIHMISMSTAAGSEEKVVNALRSRFPSEYSVVNSVGRLVSILPPHSSKGSALHALAKHMGLSSSQIAAVGDADNDMEMLAFAGFPVAMGNAVESLKMQAKHIVNANSYLELPGVAQLIREVLSAKQTKLG